ncbi:MAG TPA: DUF2892 domain-containing protein [Candidatus Thermoplasmatota archaeon]|nr:DUF2892 domain-containing protein [Candidatus Thermoplasmatota archaeon]
MGPLDAAVRFLLAIGIFLGALYALRRFDADWALTLLIHPAILAAYLVMTAAARNDILYHFLGWDTRATPRSERRGPHLRPRPRG